MTGMELTINDLGDVWEAVYEVRTKAYDMGLLLKVRVDTLDSIENQYKDPRDKLREVLKAWLKTATKPAWQNILTALRSHVVGQPKLASEIEAKTGQSSDTKLQTLQQALQDSRELLGIKDKELQESQKSMDTLQQQLQDSRELLRIKDQELQGSQRHMATLQQQLQDSQRQIQQLTHQVNDKQQTIDDKETPLQQLHRQLEAIKQDLVQPEQANQAGDQRRQELQQVVQDKPAGHELNQQLQVTRPTETPVTTDVVQQKTIRDMKWHKSKAPVEMSRGSTASDSNMAYFNGNRSMVYSYDCDTQKWCQLPDTPHTKSTLVVVQHILTMVGGYLSGKVTNSLLSLKREGEAMKWLQHFPSMPTARCDTAAVCSGHSLIVAGGGDGYNFLANVEVLATDIQQWFTACSLPQPFSEATIAICGEQLYMMGGYSETGRTRLVLTCSVHELLQCQTQPLAGKLRTAPAKQTTKWQKVADAPYYHSSCATLCGQLVAVGGGEGDMDTTAVFVYNETANKWEAMGDMSTARRLALVAILSGKMMVVGGCVGGWNETHVVEILY